MVLAWREEDRFGDRHRLRLGRRDIHRLGRRDVDGLRQRCARLAHTFSLVPARRAGVAAAAQAQSQPVVCRPLGVRYADRVQDTPCQHARRPGRARLRFRAAAAALAGRPPRASVEDRPRSSRGSQRQYRAPAMVPAKVAGFALLEPATQMEPLTAVERLRAPVQRPAARSSRFIERVHTARHRARDGNERWCATVACTFRRTRAVERSRCRAARWRPAALTRDLAEQVRLRPCPPVRASHDRRSG
jgi:hypothetical protein